MAAAVALRSVARKIAARAPPPHLAAGPLLARGLHGGASSSVPRSSLSPQRHLLHQRGLHSYTYPGASGFMPPSTSNMYKLALAGVAAIPLTLIYLYSRSTRSANKKSQEEDRLAEVVQEVAEVAASLANTVKNGAEVTASLANTVDELAEDTISVAETVKELAEDTSSLAKVVEKQAAAIKDLEADLKEKEDATKDWKAALQAEMDQLRVALNKIPTEGKGNV